MGIVVLVVKGLGTFLAAYLGYCVFLYLTNRLCDKLFCSVSFVYSMQTNYFVWHSPYLLGVSVLHETTSEYITITTLICQYFVEMVGMSWNRLESYVLEMYELLNGNNRLGKGLEIIENRVH